MIERSGLTAEDVLFRNFLIALAKECARDAARADPTARHRLMDVVQNTVPALARQIANNPSVVEQLDALSGELVKIARSGNPVREALRRGHSGTQKNAGVSAADGKQRGNS
ncbi:hypothetical protein GCM10007301_15240 [Azorhizobium oxalatiphilum]|uniref:Uncharacterized protein n=1 Tax=Azorhizobium oxalatiphilum TaxID=980631 RepID=A0A917BS07_9HYPH|nr:hypothetical protein GCM10007301_15240 [Azorhizobium oxalatiphilum]